MEPNQKPIQAIIQEFLTLSSEYFPITSASDEFYYFPQVVSPERNWSKWDRFSKEAIGEFTQSLSSLESDLDDYKQHCRIQPIPLELDIDMALLQSTLITLREQLCEVRTWEQQPTFHLSIACIGLAEALSADDPWAAEARAKSLPIFIQNAIQTLNNIPALFRELGLNMLTGTKTYLRSLLGRLPILAEALIKLDELEYFLRNTETRSDFRLNRGLLESVLYSHLDIRLDPISIQAALDSEIHDMQLQLENISNGIVPDEHWENVMAAIPLPVIPDKGLLFLYQDQITQLAKHCLSSGFLTPDDLKTCPVTVQPVPSFLSATRTASSYSVQPEHPPKGGTFYIINADNPQEASKPYQREFRILSAHETYPGHHYLDSVRLSLNNPIRRHIEKPLFYEGWACFAETLMQKTGYFDNPHDKLLLARRRLWRAIRGKVDLGLQTGDMNFGSAAEYLMKTGISKTDAKTVVYKYALNPGYQLCYTLGLKQFLSLYRSFGTSHINRFVTCAVSQGEISFQDLERVLLNQEFTNYKKS